MKSAKLTNAEVRAKGWEALIERLGPSGALRFFLQTERGIGDYSMVRHRQLGGLSADELLAQMQAVRRHAGPRRRGHARRQRAAPRKAP
jgi:hypothetical protein